MLGEGAARIARDTRAAHGRAEIAAEEKLGVPGDRMRDVGLLERLHVVFR
jgi:hypothetical protein